MSNKYKILISLVCVVLSLAVISLSAGLVLTASSMSSPTAMAIGYKNNGTTCSIKADARVYASDTDTIGESVRYQEGYNGNVSIDKDHRENKGFVRFEDVALNSAGRVVYSFTITNLSSNNKDWLCYSVDINGMTDNDNITVKLGTSEATAVEDDDAWYSVGKVGASHTFVVVMSITDPTVDALIEANVIINISYAGL
ncbi:MAG: hypothetical protein E7361_03605 [Clostridiales bacterium]|nr:hypothetical protein [Clostridiales bacterium]